jgi:hypothetical protein
MSEPPDREIVVPEPPEGSRWRLAIPIVGVAWVLLHLLIPLRYYREGADTYDERFAWRMFSSVRVRQCAVSVRETRKGTEHPVPLAQVLPAPWIELLKRNRRAVIDHFLAFRCDREGTRDVIFHNECRDATGDPLPPIELAISCADRRITGGGE